MGDARQCGCRARCVLLVHARLGLGVWDQPARAPGSQRGRGRYRGVRCGGLGAAVSTVGARGRSRPGVRHIAESAGARRGSAVVRHHHGNRGVVVGAGSGCCAAEFGVALGRIRRGTCVGHGLVSISAPGGWCAAGSDRHRSPGGSAGHRGRAGGCRAGGFTIRCSGPEPAPPGVVDRGRRGEWATADSGGGMVWLVAARGSWLDAHGHCRGSRGARLRCRGSSWAFRLRCAALNDRLCRVRVPERPSTALRGAIPRCAHDACRGNLLGATHRALGAEFGRAGAVTALSGNVPAVGGGAHRARPGPALAVAQAGCCGCGRGAGGTVRTRVGRPACSHRQTPRRLGAGGCADSGAGCSR